MSQFVNDRDIFLETQGNLNLDPRGGKELWVTVDPAVFQVDAAGVPSASFATFTAHMTGMPNGVVTWAVSAGGQLDGTLPNVRTQDFSKMSAGTIRATATIVYDGETYAGAQTLSKLRDGAAADPADITPESLLTALENRITESQLYGDLRTRINLVDSPASVIGSVAARIKAETDARVSAIGSATAKSQQDLDKEISDRIAAGLAESGARATYVQNYTFSKQETTSALSIQATQIAAAATAYTDQKTGTILSTAAADVRTYSYSKADTTSAISAAETRLRSEFNAAGGVTQADIQNWSYSKAQSDSAEAAQTTTITTAYKGYADLKKSEAKADAAADVRNYAYSKSDANAAEAAQSADLTTKYTAYADAARAAAVSTANADVRNYTYAKSATDSAIAAAESRLRSEFVGSGGATEAYVTGYAYSKSQIDQSEAAQTNAITTAYRAWAGDLQGQTLSASAADVRQYAYSKSTSDQALAAQASTLRAEFTSTNGVSQAALENYAYSKAQTNSAITQQTSTLVSTVGQHTTAIQSQATTIDGLGGQLTWKIDNNGHVSGFGLASTPINGAPYSTMIFNVDVLGVALPGGAGKPIFTVGQVNGQASAVFRSDLTVDGGITARMLKIGGSDNIIPDPKFNDLGWWGRTGFPVGDYTGQNNGWLGGAILLLTAGGGVTRSSTSRPFTSTPGATMRLEVQVQLSTDFVGEFSVYFYVEGASLYSMGCPNLGTWPSGDYPGWPIQFNSGSAKGRYNFSQEITIPLNSQSATAHMVVVDRVIAGNVAFGSCSATRVADSTLIGPGSIFTKHLDLDTGGHIGSGQTAFDTGDGFFLEGEGRGHGARMSIGRQNGRKIIIDPANNRLELVDPQIGANMTASMAPTYFNLQRNANQQFNDVYAGQYTATAGNASANLSYAWSVESTSGFVIANIRPNSANPAQATVTVTGKLSYGVSVDIYVYCTITDLNNGASRPAAVLMTVFAPDEF
jgi:hypothetical protein